MKGGIGWVLGSLFYFFFCEMGGSFLVLGFWAVLVCLGLIFFLWGAKVEIELGLEGVGGGLVSDYYLLSGLYGFFISDNILIFIF